MRKDGLSSPWLQSERFDAAQRLLAERDDAKRRRRIRRIKEANLRLHDNPRLRGINPGFTDRIHPCSSIREPEQGR